MQKSINNIEKEWTEYLFKNPTEVIPMLAALLAVMGIELDEDEETETEETPRESD